MNKMTNTNSTLRKKTSKEVLHIRFRTKEDFERFCIEKLNRPDLIIQAYKKTAIRLNYKKDIRDFHSSLLMDFFE